MGLSNYVETSTMPKFRFVVKAESGIVRRGTITERDQESARTKLENSGFQVVSLTESTDVQIHSSSSPSGGQKLAPPVRASIIDFEDTMWEKIKNFLNRFVLRRETAMLLGVAGVIWLIVNSMRGEEKPRAIETNYVSYKIQVTVDVQNTDAHYLKVRLPEVPLTKMEEIQPDDDGTQSLMLDFESMTRPTRVETMLQDNEEKVHAKAKSLLEAGTKTEFELRPNLIAVSHSGY